MSEHEAAMRRRLAELQGELDRAADHRIGTTWWADRCREMDRIEARLALIRD